MDPNACLQRIITAARDNDRDEYIAACEDLAGWLRAGGFKPTVPEGTKYIPGTNTSWTLLSPIGTGLPWALIRWTVLGGYAERYELEG
jgi:hypothetical protein